MSRALVVDDVVENRTLLRTLLEGHGFCVDEAAHGAAALSSARASPPDLVITDLLMPVMDGYTLLRAWKADARLKSIPFVVYTATYTESKDEKLALDLGADAFMVKPTEPNKFMHTLEHTLARAKTGRLPSSPPREGDTFKLLAQHNDALIAKLAHRAAQLEDANRALEADILQRKLAEARVNALLRELRSKTAQLEQALNMARMGVFCWNFQTDAFATLEGRGPVTGLAAADYPATGVALLALVHPEDRANLEAKLAGARSGDDFDLEFRVVPRAGEPRWAAVRGRCVHDAAGAAAYLIGLDQDVTERKGLEDRLRSAQKMEALGRLSGGIAHDFNNVLMAIIGNAELGSMDAGNADTARRCLDEIVRAAQRGRDLTQRILGFSRPTAERIVPTGLESVLLEAEHLLRATLPAGIELRFEVQPELPAVRADASQIHQVLLNLFTNARDAIGETAGCIEARLFSRLVERELCAAHPELQPGPHVCLSIADSGSGMDANALERIFEPFYTTKGPGRGVGLGLSVVHGIVRAHGGAIFAESTLGRGTTFSVLLPACDAAVSVQPPPPAPACNVTGGGQRILYLDDEPPLVYLAVRSLQGRGYQVDGFTRASDALRVFGAAPTRYDAAITDYNMPEMSGVDFAQQLLLVRPDLPIALTTGYLAPEEHEHVRAAGIHELISKPYLFDELGPLLQRLLARRGELVAGLAHSAVTSG